MQKTDSIYRTAMHFNLNELPPLMRKQAVLKLGAQAKPIITKDIAMQGGRDSRRSSVKVGVVNHEGLEVEMSLSRLQAQLWAVLKDEPGATLEHSPGIPGRRFRIDIAFPQALLAVEVDGWQHHGKYKADFVRDRLRQNLLTLHGWRILRYSATTIYNQPDECLAEVRKALSQTNPT